MDEYDAHQHFKKAAEGLRSVGRAMEQVGAALAAATQYRDEQARRIPQLVEWNTDSELRRLPYKAVAELSREAEELHGLQGNLLLNVKRIADRAERTQEPAKRMFSELSIESRRAAVHTAQLARLALDFEHIFLDFAKSFSALSDYGNVHEPKLTAHESVTGSTAPVDECCLQAAGSPFPEGHIQATHYARALRAYYGPFRPGIELSVEVTDYDGGGYWEVVCRYDPGIEEAAELARSIIDRGLDTWDATALGAPFEVDADTGEANLDTLLPEYHDMIDM